MNKYSCCTDLGELLSPKFFKALADPNRLKILVELTSCCEPQTVTEVSTCCPIDISVVSRHLAMLRDAGILEASRRGKEVRYSVRFDVLAQTLRTIADAIESCCPPSKEISP